MPSMQRLARIDISLADLMKLAQSKTSLKVGEVVRLSEDINNEGSFHLVFTGDDVPEAKLQMAYEPFQVPVAAPKSTKKAT